MNRKYLYIFQTVVMLAIVFPAYHHGLKDGVIRGYGYGVASRDTLELSLAKSNPGQKNFYILSTYKSADELLSAGDRLFFEPNGIFEGPIAINSQGEENNPIIVDKFPNKK